MIVVLLQAQKVTPAQTAYISDYFGVFEGLLQQVSANVLMVYYCIRNRRSMRLL